MNERIGTLIEGEGLMNDGSAIVLFNVFKLAITSKDNLTPGGCYCLSTWYFGDSYMFHLSI